ncbi:MAG: peroxiredoxin [Proteobacteria bacterium]|nr:peroxiredoxin [Pseudomonadota bacterium]
MTVEVGQAAPDFTLPGDGERTISLAGLRGKRVVLFFYPKDMTPGCTIEARAFTALHDDFAAANTRVVGLSKDSVARHEKFRAKHDLKSDLASDETGEVLEAYGVWTEKSMFGRKYMGIVRSTFLIDEAGIIRQIWRRVKVGRHAEEVLKEAQGL